MTGFFRFDNFLPPSHSITPPATPKQRMRVHPPGLPPGPFLARGEAALWAAVITQALMDALHKPTTAEAKYYKHEATLWLTSDSRDFRTVCEYAGFEPDYVRRMAKRAISNPRKWRADPGQGERYMERREYRRKMKRNVHGERWMVNGAQKLPSPATIHQPPCTMEFC